MFVLPSLGSWTESGFDASALVPLLMLLGSLFFLQYRMDLRNGLATLLPGGFEEDQQLRLAGQQENNNQYADGVQKKEISVWKSPCPAPFPCTQ